MRSGLLYISNAITLFSPFFFPFNRRKTFNDYFCQGIINELPKSSSKSLLKMAVQDFGGGRVQREKRKKNGLMVFVFSLKELRIFQSLPHLSYLNKDIVHARSIAPFTWKRGRNQTSRQANLLRPNQQTDREINTLLYNSIRYRLY